LRGRRTGKLKEAAKAFYHRLPTAEKARAAGYEVADYEIDDVEVWPENWPAYLLFTSLQTQWNVGMGGRAGLKYEALYPLLDRQTDTPEQWQQLFDDVRVMEYAALDQMAEDAAD
jgi:hypothetical protein